MIDLAKMVPYSFRANDMPRYSTIIQSERGATDAIPWYFARGKEHKEARKELGSQSFCVFLCFSWPVRLPRSAFTV
jgi:hypothetical protein